MQHNKYRSRLTVIFIVLLVGLLGIFWPPTRLFQSVPFSQKLNLRPGIDIRGGVKLVYNIKATGSNVEPNLAEKVAEALKKRVDPNGVMNLVWRPQGNTLEIWMPLSGNEEKSKEVRAQLNEAQRQLDRLNVSMGRVTEAMEMTDKAAREKRLEELAGGYPKRLEILQKMAAAQDKLAEAKKMLTSADPKVQEQGTIDEVDAQRALRHDVYGPDGKKTGEAGLEVDLENTNLYARTVQSTILDLYQGGIDKLAGSKSKAAEKLAERNNKVDELIGQWKDFPARQAAIKDFVARYDEHMKLRGAVGDAEDLKRLLRGSGVLEFHILWDSASGSSAQDNAIAKEMSDRLKKEGPVQKTGDIMRWYEVEQPDQMKGRPTYEWGGRTWALAYITPNESMVHTPGEKDWGLEGAHRTQDPNTMENEVAFNFNARGARLFGDLTGSHIHRPLAIVLDNRIISAPNINSRIEGSGVITGQYTSQELDYLIRTLNAGSLPARLDDEPIREQIVSSTYGAENLRDGFASCLIGLVVVAVFLFGYYYLSGAVAMVAVLMNMVIILGVLALFNATFTLPGIAGLVLTLGSAVDANVLIFERLREEQHRGLSVRMALRNAYDRAFSAILDSNVITIITSLVLYWVGTEEVKGFGLTLLIGIASSLFTALFVTRVIFDMMLEKYHIEKFGSLPLTFPKWDQFLKPKISWMGLVWVFVLISVVLMSAGLVSFVRQGRNMYDIEFVQGTSVVFGLKKPMSQPEVAKLVSGPEYQKSLPSAQVIAIGNEKIEYQLDTPNANQGEVREALMSALGDRLDVKQPSTFKGSDLADKFEQAMSDGVVRKADKTLVAAIPWARSTILDNENGVAIHLVDLKPALTGEEITARITQYGGSGLSKIEVETPSHDPKKPATEALVVVPPGENLVQDPDGAHWRAAARPEWEGVVNAINKKAAFKSINNFPAVVADAMKGAAAKAMILSIIGILIYIWLRFGNVKYGAATVIAMIHDVLIVLGLIGLSHWMSGTMVGHWLKMEPFRINLTIVAAILTVMGYSMLDTIVVFDRIRENRGKFGYINKGVIDDSINQTLSRTLLTCGTTLVTVTVMYFFGGPSIHGFTFVLLGGILVGTYSSIAIASPILLMGGKDVRKSGAGAPVTKTTPAGQPQRAAR